MKKTVLLVAAMAFLGVSSAQVGTTVKEGAKATAEKASR